MQTPSIILIQVTKSNMHNFLEVLVLGAWNFFFNFFPWKDYNANFQCEITDTNDKAGIKGLGHNMRST